MPVVRETSWGAIVTGVMCRVCGSDQFPTMRIGSKLKGVPCEHLCSQCAARLLADLEVITEPCEQCGSIVPVRPL